MSDAKKKVNSTAKKTVKCKEFTERKWKKGVSGNPKGRPAGSRDFKTIYIAAIKKIAESKGIEPSEYEDSLTKKAIEIAESGNVQFYKDTMDRVHGKAVDRTEITGKDGKDLPTPLLHVIQHHNSNGEDIEA